MSERKVELARASEAASSLPLREAFSSLAAMDADALVGFCDPRVSFESRLTAVDRETYRGHEGVRQYIANLSRAFEHIEVEVADLCEHEGKAVFTSTLRGRGRASGVEVEQRFNAAALGRDRKLLWWAFFDSRAQACESVGLTTGGEHPAPVADPDEPARAADAVPRAEAESELPASETHGYALGHSRQELDRLQVQARLIEPITRRFFREAGLAPGMRVLDVGSGVGDVAFLVAELVGEHGEVVGVDRSGDALAIARERARRGVLSNVSFHEGDPAAMRFEPDFDAVIGRYVLMFQPDPAAMLAAVAAHARPGALIAFHEPEWACARSDPHVASWNRCCELVVAAMTAKGADMQMGMKLHSVFIAAGLPAPSMRYEAVIGAGAGSADQVHYTTDVAVTLLADIEELGLVSPGEIDPATFADRVLADVASSESVIVGRSEIGAWAHTRG